jgi:hypothetical protein
MIAAGRMGAHLSANGTTNALGSAYGSGSFFSCAVNMAAPIGPTVGKARIYFELLVKGTLENSTFINLPGLRKLKDLFNDYIAGTVEVEDAKMRAVQRDVSLTAPLILGAVQSWNDYTGTLNPTVAANRGQVLYLHGDVDSVVPASDTQLSYNVLAGMTATQVGYATDGNSATVVTAPGVNLTARVFTGGGHFDTAYYTATGTYPDNYIGTASVDAANTALAGQGFLDKTSYLNATTSSVLSSWMTSKCVP